MYVLVCFFRLIKALFGYTQSHSNPHGLGGIEVEFSLSFTSILSNHMDWGLN